MQVFLFHNYIIEFTYFVLRHISFNFLFKKQKMHLFVKE